MGSPSSSPITRRTSRPTPESAPPPIFALSAYNLPLSSPSANRGPSGSKPSQRSRPVNIRWLSRARRTRSSARSCTSRSTFRDIGPRLTSNDSTAVLYNSESVPQWVATDDDFSWQTRAAVTRGAPGTSALQRDPGIESSPREQPPSVRLQRRCGTTSLREAHEEDPAVRRAIGSPGLHGPQRRSCSVPAQVRPPIPRRRHALEGAAVGTKGHDGEAGTRRMNGGEQAWRPAYHRTPPPSLFRARLRECDLCPGLRGPQSVPGSDYCASHAIRHFPSQFHELLS